MEKNILVNVINVKCCCEHVLIYSGTEESHINHLEKDLALLLKHVLRIPLKKCSIMQPRVELSGHCIDKEGILKGEIRVQNIRNTRPPSSQKQLRSCPLEIHQKYREDCKTPVRVDFGKSRFRVDTANAEIIQHAKTNNYNCPQYWYIQISVSRFY